MRPLALTWVASVMTSPMPPIASCSRCDRCQSLATPSSLLYWHIDDNMIRFSRVMGPTTKGSNKLGIVVEV